jgi:uracil-DNA glycosylase family 4
MLNDAGIPPASCRFGNLMEIRPPKNNFGYFYLDPDKRQNPSPELRASVQRLQDEIRQVRPNVVLALGSEPLKWLTGRSGIDKHRGSIFDSNSQKIIGTYHPAAILRSYDLRPIAQIDIQRVAEESLFPQPNLPRLSFEINPSFERVCEFLKTEPELIAFDIETLGRQIRCLGIADSSTHAICIPFIRVQGSAYAKSKTLISPPSPSSVHFWSEPEELHIHELLQEFFQNPRIRKVAQNISFDLTLLSSEFKLRFSSLYMDTMIAHRLCYNEFPSSLDFLASVYTRLPYWSDYDPRSDTSTWTYNCFDCVATYQVSERLVSELRNFNLSKLYFSHAHPLAEALTMIQNRGALINVESRQALGQPVLDELRQIDEKITLRLGRPLNPESPLQVKDAIRSLGYQVPQKDGKETTNAQEFDKLISRHPNETLFPLILAHRELRKLYGTYITAPLDDDNRMRTSYSSSGTVFGRISSSQTIWKTGGNLQNIPKTDFRRIFISSPGFVFLHADLSQAESRAVAWLSRDSNLMDRFRFDPHFDVHRYNAAVKIYGIPESSITPIQRQRGKACGHSGNYGIGPRKFAWVARIPLSEAKVILPRYQSNPHLQAWWTQVRDQLHSNRTLVTPFGRQFRFFGRLDQETFRRAYSAVPQSTVGDIVNRAIYLLESSLDPLEARVILQVHDEIDLEVREDSLRKIALFVKQVLETPIQFYPDQPPLVIPVEISSGPNWHDQTPLDLT